MPGSIRLINPSDESLVRELPLAGLDEADLAIQRARSAAPVWKAVAPADRSRLLRRFADLIGHNADELARLETANMGMPIGSSTWCANAAADVIHYFAGAVDRFKQGGLGREHSMHVLDHYTELKNVFVAT